MSNALKVILLLTFAMLVGRASEARSKPLKIVENLDVTRYAGRWYEIARLPNWFERNCSGNVTATYSVNGDGTIDVLNSCGKKSGGQDSAHGIARFKDPGAKRAHLKVTFAPSALRSLPFVWADYCVIALDPEYRFALVGEPGRKYLWILSRQNPMNSADFESLLKVAEEQGFNTSRLIRNN